MSGIQNVPIDAHVYEIWANGGVDPWPSNGLSAVKSTFLCYGPRGCGKTFLANAFFNSTTRNIIDFDSVAVLKNPDEKLPKVFKSALRNSGSSGLLIEDVDNLFINLRSRPSAHSFLLNQLKAPDQLLIFATAARPDDMQPAEVDVFQYVLPVFYGDAGLREVIMVTQAENVPLDFDVDIQKLAELTEWWSGRELMELVTKSPLNEESILTQESLLREINLIKSNIIPEQRAKRMRELLMFTSDHGTSQVIRDEIKYRFGSNFIVASDRVPTTLRMNENLQVDHGPRVFISYSWDSKEHKNWVLTFVNRLRQQGVDAFIDQTHLPLGGRTPQFMERSVRESERVLVICTESYKDRFDNREGGAGYEGHIITGEIVNKLGKNKFIPVLRSGDWKSAVPTALSGISGVDLSTDSDEEFQKLADYLLGISRVVPVGKPASQDL